MEIRRIWYSIVRKWWLIVLLAILGGGISFMSVSATKPIYQAETTLYIMNRDKVLTTGQSLNSQDIAVSQQMVRQYSEIISSRLVTTAVARDVKNYNLTENQILSMVNITSNKDSNILTISALSPDPTAAAAVANATGREFTTQIRQLTNSDNVGILDEALIPNYPVSNNGSKKVLLGLLTGLMVALGIIYIIEYFDTTVRSVQDIEKGLKVRVIGIIPEHDIR